MLPATIVKDVLQGLLNYACHLPSRSIKLTGRRPCVERGLTFCTPSLPLQLPCTASLPYTASLPCTASLPASIKLTPQTLQPLWKGVALLPTNHVHTVKPWQKLGFCSCNDFEAERMPCPLYAIPKTDLENKLAKAEW